MLLARLFFSPDTKTTLCSAAKDPRLPRSRMPRNFDDVGLEIAASVAMEGFTYSESQSQVNSEDELGWNTAGARQVVLLILPRLVLLQLQELRSSFVETRADSVCTLCKPCPFPLCSSRFGWRIGRLQLISRYMLSFYPICLYRFSVTEKEMNAVSTQRRVYPSLLWTFYYSRSHVCCVFWCKAFSLSKQESAGTYLFLTSIFNCGQFLIIYF